MLDHALAADNMRVQMVAGERFSIIDTISNSISAVSEDLNGGTQLVGRNFGWVRPYTDVDDLPDSLGSDDRGDAKGGPGSMIAGGGGHGLASVNQTEERLKRLKVLLERGVLTQDEHDAQRAAVISVL